MIVIIKQKKETDNTPANDFITVLANSNATLIDGSMLPQMARIDIHNADIDTLKADLGEHWEMFPERKYTVPDTKRKISNKKMTAK